jgi:integrase
VSVEPAPNGGWKVRWRDPSKLDKNGKPSARSKTFMLKKDAQSFDRDVKSALQRGVRVDGGRKTGTTFNALADEWREAQRPILGKKTLRDYEGQLDNHLRPIIGSEVVSSIDAARVFRLRSEVAKTAPDYTTARVLKLFRQIMSFGLLIGRVGPSNPADIIGTRGFLPSQKRQKDIRPLWPEQVEAVRLAMLERKSPYALRDATLMSVLAYAGLRPEEALALTWEHIAPTSIRVEFANVNGNIKAATKTWRRTIGTFPPELRDDLTQWRKACPDSSSPALVFCSDDGGAFTKFDYDNWRKRTFKPCAPDDAVPYDVRHGHASLLIRSGWDLVRVAKRMGHSPATCLHHYAHVFDAHEDTEEVSWLEAISSARATSDVSSGCPEDTQSSDQTGAPKVYLQMPEGLTRYGARRDRTDDLLLAKQALSQLSYGPEPERG